MKKSFCIIGSVFLLFLIVHANERGLLISEQEKYWGQYVYYKSISGKPQKGIGEIIMLKNETITFYSHHRQKASSFVLKDNYIEYQLGKGRKRRIFYNRSQNILYEKKPGKFFFIPEKINFFPVNSEIAKKQIQEWL